MNRAQQKRQAEADAWLSQHEGWDEDIPDPDSLAQPLFTCHENEDGREKYDTRRAVSEPGPWLPDLPNTPRKRKRRNKKAANIQLIRGASEQECLETAEFNAAVSERINRKRDFSMRQYTGKYREVLSLLLLGLPTKIIAEQLGKTPRRIRHIVNGNAKRGTIGLRQFLASLCEPPPDVGRTPRLAVAGVEHGI
jgi:DNA-binding CsgD family transcriptional regulator